MRGTPSGTGRRRTKIISHVFILAWSCGCSGRPDPADGALGIPGLISREEDHVAPRPSAFQIIRPTDGERIEAGRPLACRLRVTLSEGETLPTNINFELRLKDAIVDSCSARREEGGASEPTQPAAYDFVGELKQTRRAGRCRLETSVVSTQFVSPKPGDETGPIPSTKSIRLKPVEIEIRR